MLKKLSFFTFLLLLNTHSWANDTEIISLGHGLAMHGEVKEAADALHLSYANPTAPKGGILKQAVIGSFDSVNPFALKGTSAQGLHLTYERLTHRSWNEPFTLYPLIARDIEFNQDRSQMRITLDQNAKFSDGSPITAEDVLFSFNILKNEGRPNMRRVYRLVDSIQIQDDQRIKIVLGEGHDQETAMILAMMPVLSKSYWSTRKFDSATLEAPITSGPYLIEKIDVGRQIIYKRNPNYWAKNHAVMRGHNNFDRVVYDYFRDDSVALEAFQKGDLSLRSENDITKWETAYSNNAENYKKLTFPHGRPVPIQSLIFNMRRAPFDNIFVREALNLAFDADWINKNIYFGKLSRINSFFENSELEAPKSHDLWQPENSLNNKARRKNLIKASKLLNKSGFQIDNGVLKNDKGQPFSFEIIVQTTTDEKIALNFSYALQRLGIEAKVRNFDTAAFRDRLNIYDYDMAAYFWRSSLSPGTEQYLYWSCEAAKQNSRWNMAGICNKEIDRLAGVIPMKETRSELLDTVHQLDEALLNQVPFIPLFYSAKDLIAVQNTVTPAPVTPLYGPVIETWWQKEE